MSYATLKHHQDYLEAFPMYFHFFFLGMENHQVIKTQRARPQPLVGLSEAKDLHFFHKFPGDRDTVVLGTRTL